MTGSRALFSLSSINLLVVGLLTACAGTTTISTWHLQPATPTPPVTAPRCVVEIVGVSMPDPFDRAEFVLNGEAQQWVFAGQAYWASAFPQVVAGRLAARLEQQLNLSGPAKIAVYASQRIGVSPDLQLRVQFNQIQNRLTEQGANFAASVNWTTQQTIISTAKPPKTIPQGMQVNKVSPRADYAGLVQATAQAVDAMADQIVQQLPLPASCKA